MPEQPQSTVSEVPEPSLPVPTPAELAAQEAALEAVADLSALRSRLWMVHLRLGERPREDDDMGELRVPDSIRFAVRTAIECVNEEPLEAAIKALQKAALATPASLDREWGDRLKLRGQGLPAQP